jgi:hypothetical protein
MEQHKIPGTNNNKCERRKKGGAECQPPLFTPPPFSLAFG